jgi:hypothetical protein
MRVCVYCASSGEAHADYRRAAFELGAALARGGALTVYGGGSAGSMGALADGVLSAGGEVLGILPRFMADLEWGHPGLTRLELVDDMRERKHRLLTDSDAVVALPGGCGTLEELFEAITLKRLGLYFGPIVLLNTRGFYDDVLRLLDNCVAERFMNPEHRGMWSAVDRPDQVLDEIARTPPWRKDARDIAVVRPRA